MIVFAAVLVLQGEQGKALFDILPPWNYKNLMRICSDLFSAGRWLRLINP